MGRPKGSKNAVKSSRKGKAVSIISNNLEEQISEAENNIVTLTASLKDEKRKLKLLQKAKQKADKQSAKIKKEEDKKKLLEALETSGKSVDEIISFINAK